MAKVLVADRLLRGLARDGAAWMRAGSSIQECCGSGPRLWWSCEACCSAGVTAGAGVVVV